jgi:hypothetical protein
LGRPDPGRDRLGGEELGLWLGVSQTGSKFPSFTFWSDDLISNIGTKVKTTVVFWH